MSKYDNNGRTTLSELAGNFLRENGEFIFLVILILVSIYVFDAAHQNDPDILSRDSCVAGYKHSRLNGQLRQIFDAHGKGIPCN